MLSWNAIPGCFPLGGISYKGTAPKENHRETKERNREALKKNNQKHLGKLSGIFGKTIGKPKGKFKETLRIPWSASQCSPKMAYSEEENAHVDGISK